MFWTTNYPLLCGSFAKEIHIYIYLLNICTFFFSFCFVLLCSCNVSVSLKWKHSTFLSSEYGKQTCLCQFLSLTGFTNASQTNTIHWLALIWFEPLKACPNQHEINMSPGVTTVKHTDEIKGLCVMISVPFEESVNIKKREGKVPSGMFFI